MSLGHKPGARYKRLVQMGETANDCWVWLGNINKQTGYGHKQWHGKTLSAHRWIWEIFFGQIPDDRVINHKCRNRGCVNPHHLEVVSQAANCRHGAGTKLTADIVRKIREIEPQWGDRLGIAKKYGISPMTVSDIRNRRSWVEV